MKVRINKEIGGYKPNTIIYISENDEKAQYWHRRLQDAKIDNCCEIIEENKKLKNVIQSSKKSKKYKI